MPYKYRPPAINYLYLANERTSAWCRRVVSIVLPNGNINDAKYDDDSSGEEHNQLDPAESFQDEAKTPDNDPLTRVR
jgi:hypothetical protein